MRHKKRSVDTVVKQNIFFDDDGRIINVESIDRDIKINRSQRKKILKKKHLGLLKGIHEHKTNILIEQSIKDKNEIEITDIFEDKIEIITFDKDSDIKNIIEIVEDKVKKVIENSSFDNIENDKSSHKKSDKSDEIYNRIDISIREEKINNNNKTEKSKKKKQRCKLKFIDEIMYFEEVQSSIFNK